MKFSTLRQMYKMRWRRRRLLLRALLKRRQLVEIVNRTDEINASDILVASTVRNEYLRLPHFLEHHRSIGVNHFLFVDNGSDDGTADYLKEQPDVSVWRATNSYKLSRFGMDWLTYLQMKYAHNHWCLTLDADEIFIYPHWTKRPLKSLTNWLDENSNPSFGALMLDMYPSGPVNDHAYLAGTDPFQSLCWFDADGYRVQSKPDLEGVWVQGGVRDRMFFRSDPRRAPTLNKIPLVKWNRRYAYLSSTHSALPRKLNCVFDRLGGEIATGVLLHTKFLNTIVEKSAEEVVRKEHFENSDLYTDYYRRLMENPTLWSEQSTKYQGWEQLEQLGLMSRGEWK